MHSQKPAPFHILGSAEANERAWLSWMEEFQGYAQSVGFDEMPKKRRRDLLLRCVGRDVRKLIGDRRLDTILDYDWLLIDLSSRFQSSKNLLYNRFCFRQCLRQLNEPFERYIYRLKMTAQECNFTDVDVEIMDHVIDKCGNDELRHSLLRETDIDLSKMVELVTNYEENVRVSKSVKEPADNNSCGNTTANNNSNKKKNKKKRKKNPKNTAKDKTEKNEKQNGSGAASKCFVTEEVLDTYVII